MTQCGLNFLIGLVTGGAIAIGAAIVGFYSGSRHR